MRVLPTTKKIGRREDLRQLYNLKQFEKQCADFVLLEGGFGQFYKWEQFNLSQAEIDTILSGKLVRLEFEEPNKFCLPDDTDSYDRYFDKIFTICPYTATWLNNRQHTNKRIPICYPVNEDYVPRKVKKLYDIIYTGTIVSKSLLEDIQDMSHYNYRFISQKKHPLVTNFDVSYADKLKLLAQSKVALIHNLLFPRLDHMFFIWITKEWYNNEAFRLVPPWYKFWDILNNKNVVIPQVKNRLFESALCRTLILCRKDPFNIVENFFEPEREFVYYEQGKLDEKLKEILGNYKKYQPIIERAYKKAHANYTTRALVKNYLSKLYR